jgi:hypothetical protein
MTPSKVFVVDTDRRASAPTADALRKAAVVVQIVNRSSRVSLARSPARDVIAISDKHFVCNWIKQPANADYVALDITRAGEDEKPGSTSAIRARSAASHLTKPLLTTRTRAEPTQPTNLPIPRQAPQQRSLNQHCHGPPERRCKSHAMGSSLVAQHAFLLWACVPWRHTRQRDSTGEHRPLSSYSCHLPGPGDEGNEGHSIDTRHRVRLHAQWGFLLRSFQVFRWLILCRETSKTKVGQRKAGHRVSRPKPRLLCRVASAWSRNCWLINY